MEKYFEQAWNQNDYSILDESFVEGAKIRTPLGEYSGPEGLKEVAEIWFRRFPSLGIQILQLIEENDLVAAHWKAITKNFEYQGVSIHRFMNGKVQELWVYIDRIL